MDHFSKTASPPAPNGSSCCLCSVVHDVESRSRPLYPMMLEPPELRWSFIQKIYSIVSVQLLLTIAVVALVMITPFITMCLLFYYHQRHYSLFCFWNRFDMRIYQWLKSMAPVSYLEKRIPYKEEKVMKNVEINIKEGSEPEVYTEEHGKLLGDSKATWTLYVDEYDEDGQQIYDPVEGKSFHQCRQKTLGHHTECSKCKIVQGQFCGDCLYMRQRGKFYRGLDINVFKALTRLV